MKVGVTIWFQNMPDMLERGIKGDYSKPIPMFAKEVLPELRKWRTSRQRPIAALCR